MKTVGSNIHSLRLSKRMTQQQLSDAAGMDQSHLSRIELNKHQPSIATLTAIAHAMNLPAAELMRGL